jgi:uncharacterized protein DUF3617
MQLLTKRVILATIVLTVAGICWAQTQKSTKDMRSSADSQTALKVQPLNIKPGLWENTRTINRAGQMPIPGEMLNRLSPEQRARMEERMNAHSAAHTNTSTEKHCVTKEDIEKDRLRLAEAKECTTTVINTTTTTVKAKLVCDQEGMHATGTLELVATDSEHVSGSYQSTVDANGHTMNVDGTWTSKWLGSSCGDMK